MRLNLRELIRIDLQMKDDLQIDGLRNSLAHLRESLTNGLSHSHHHRPQMDMNHSLSSL
jgi:hypothetical protein